MRHEMKLFSDLAFNQIASGNKTVELRLRDEKCSLLNIGDQILFKMADGRSVLTEVTGLCHFTNFLELFQTIPPVLSGFEINDSVGYAADWMYSIYTADDIEKYGALGIVIKKII
ncbi:MAG: hypothetical protein LBF37_00760 [Rickettsiales bacterium]|jgi:ASC-1-like (ASCH) protein|nr:hypothetical protein [Rickettsiales bacterium]